MKAFLSYQVGDDISTVHNLLLKNNIEIFDALTDLQFNHSYQQDIKDIIKKCDFIVIIYSKDNPNLAFEAGVAIGSNKPIFSILAGGNENIFLLDSTYVHVQPSETEKIEFSLELFLENINLKKNLKPVINPNLKFYGGGEVTPVKDYFDIEMQYASVRNKTGSDLEDFIQEMLKAYGVKVVKNTKKINYNNEYSEPDFAIWYDELSSLLNNPINIRVKNIINPTNLPFSFSNNSIGSTIVLYDKLVNITPKHLPISSDIIFISIPNLVGELSSHGFAESIKRVRNALIHNK